MPETFKRIVVSPLEQAIFDWFPANPKSSATRSEEGPEVTTIEDIRLVSDAKKGCAESFEALMSRHMGPAKHVAYGYVRNRDDATDLAQEAFARSYSALDRFRDGEPFAPWFYRILRNACLNFLDRRRRRRALSIETSGFEGERMEIADPKDLDPVRRAENHESQSCFWELLDQLSPAHKDVILLRHVEELEYQEIAEVLGIPVGTVMSRLYHARRRLRGLLEPYVEGRA